MYIHIIFVCKPIRINILTETHSIKNRKLIKELELSKMDYLIVLLLFYNKLNLK